MACCRSSGARVVRSSGLGEQLKRDLGMHGKREARASGRVLASLVHCRWARPRLQKGRCMGEPTFLPVKLAGRAWREGARP